MGFARPAEASKEVTEDPAVEDEKRRNYGGVYVGLPTDMTTVASSQSKSTHKVTEAAWGEWRGIIPGGRGSTP
nr:PREDICTED: overexpressed in colon carcinoma 1 protein [Paralichthys olivaceus]